jgi:DNA-binding transcriptional ArsR family regulator
MIQPAAINAVMRTLADPTRRAVFERIVSSDEITVVELTRGSGVTQAVTFTTAPSQRGSRRSSIG